MKREMGSFQKKTNITSIDKKIHVIFEIKILPDEVKSLCKAVKRD